MMIKNCSWTSLSIITGHGAQRAFCHSEQKDFVSSRNDFCVIWFFFMFYSQVESGMLILLNQPTGDASNGCQYSREHLLQIILWFWCFVFGVLMCDGEFSLWDQAHSISFGPSSLVYFRWILRINSSVSMWFISFDSTAVAFNSDPCGINDIIMYTTHPVSTLSSLMEPQEASDSRRVVTWLYSVRPSFEKIPCSDPCERRWGGRVRRTPWQITAGTPCARSHHSL